MLIFNKHTDDNKYYSVLGKGVKMRKKVYILIILLVAALSVPVFKYLKNCGLVQNNILSYENTICFLNRNFDICLISAGDKKIIKCSKYYFIFDINDKYICARDDTSDKPKVVLLDYSCRKQYIIDIDTWSGTLMGDKLYYVNSEDNKIYSINYDSSENIKISDERASAVKGFENYLYYDNADNGHFLYRMRSDGEDISLIDKEVFSYNFEIKNNYVFAQNYNDKCLYKIDLDTMKKEKVSDVKMNSFTVSEDRIYYTKYMEIGEPGEDYRRLYLLDNK